MVAVGFLILLAGFILVTATVRVAAFKSSTREGVFTFIVPFYCWWYGFVKLKKTGLMSVVLCCFVIGGGMSLVGSIRQNVLKAKTAEARSTLQRMAKACEEFRNEFMTYPAPGGMGIHPGLASPGFKCDGTVREFTSHSKGVPRGRKEPPDVNPNDEIWNQLKMSFNDPTYFRYTYRVGCENGEPWYELVAEGDLNGDGVASKFIRRGGSKGGGNMLEIINEFE